MTKSIIAILLLVSCTCYAQFVITGKILEEKTKSPVPYASISITNSRAGSATDEKGDFWIKVEQEQRKEKLSISCLGFSNRLLSIDSLALYKNRDMTIYMKPLQIMLEDVTIRDSKLSALQFLQYAFAAIPENYSQTPFNMEFYSKMELKDSAKTYYTQETILTSYRKGYIPGATNWSTITQQRITGESPLAPHVDRKTNRKYFPFNPSFNISLIDQTGNFKENGKFYSIYNPKTFRDMVFSYAGTSVFDKDTVMAIEYQRKKSKKIEGTLYIAVNNLAIVRHTSKLFGFDIIYKRIDGLYYPYFFSRTYNISSEKGLKNSHLLQTVFLRSVSTKNLTVFERNTPSVYWAEDIPYNKEYWDTNFPKKVK